jgi:hypothetical protein
MYSLHLSYKFVVFSVNIESETFDLSGQNVAAIEKTIHEAFSEPMDLSEMIRITFIVGAGKLGRARYDDNAAKAVTTALREVGFEEDRGASSVMDCAGSFKLQHDTGKNLKTVVVFPKVKSLTDGAGVGESSVVDKNTSIFLEDSIHHKIAYASMSVFQKMIESQCPTWSQKKECVNVLNEIRQLATSLEVSLVNGKAISNAEQEFFDSVSITSIDEKLTFIRECLQKHVETSDVTNFEKQFLLNQVQKKIEELELNIDIASKEGKPKRVEMLKEAQKVANGRIEKVKMITPIGAPKLKNDREIRELRSELAPLLELKESSKGRLLTLKESQSVSRIDEIEDQIRELEVGVLCNLLFNLFFN